MMYLRVLPPSLPSLAQSAPSGEPPLPLLLEAPATAFPAGAAAAAELVVAVAAATRLRKSRSCAVSPEAPAAAGAPRSCIPRLTRRPASCSAANDAVRTKRLRKNMRGQLASEPPA